jgi:hypothetical protein
MKNAENEKFPKNRRKTLKKDARKRQDSARF